MQTELFSISKLFTERLLRIPDYQRGYSWTEKQLKDFWGDLEQLEENKNHYVGVLTLEEVPCETVNSWVEDQWITQAKHFASFFIVDGQQRLTTTLILLQAILEATPPEKQLNYTSLEEIRKKFLYDSKDGGVSRSYIFGYEKDNPSYDYLKHKIFCEPIPEPSNIQETIYTSNLEQAKEFFLKRLKNATLDDLEGIFSKITQRFLFNIYSISNEVDVFVAFETMNNRGKELSHLELLKNRLIYLSTKFDTEDYEKTALRKLINDCWRSVYHYLGKNKLNPLDDDFFLENHFLLYFGDELLKSDERMSTFDLYFNMRHHKDYLLDFKFTSKNISLPSNPADAISVSDIKRYASSLKDSVETWYQILNPSDSDYSVQEREYLEKIIRLDKETAAPLIMVVFQKSPDPEVRKRMLVAIERFLFIMSLAYGSFIRHEKMAFIPKALKILDNRISPEEAVAELELNNERMVKDKNFQSNFRETFKKGNFYKWRGINYFLFEYDLYLRSQSKTERQKLEWNQLCREEREFKSEFYTIEHIYPQSPRRRCWTVPFKKYTTKERTLLRHSLGNLLPLSKAKNSSFNNKCFEEKLGDEGNKVGYRYGCYAENEVACISTWTGKEILDRGIKLLNFLESRWGIPLGGTNQKIKFLKLGFVIKKDSGQIDFQG